MRAVITSWVVVGLFCCALCDKDGVSEARNAQFASSEHVYADEIQHTVAFSFRNSLIFQYEVIRQVWKPFTEQLESVSDSGENMEKKLGQHSIISAQTSQTMNNALLLISKNITETLPPSQTVEKSFC